MVNREGSKSMDRKKVLWLSACVPVKNGREAGTKTFFYYYEKMRGDSRFDIKMIAFCKQYLLEEAIEDNRGYDIDYIVYDNIPKYQKLINIESRYNPFNRYAGLIPNYSVQQLFKKLKSLKSNGYIPEIVILEWTQLVVLAKDIKGIFPSCKIVASEHDVTFVGYKRKAEYFKGINGYIWKFKYIREKSKELGALKHCDLILPHNEDNTDILIQEGINKKRIQWLTPYFNNMKDCHWNGEERSVLFFGAMARPENYLSAIWYIENVMPRIQDLKLKFVVLGSNPAEVFEKYINDEVIVTGFVEDVTPYFEKSLCLVAPLVLGAGIKVKILEAMSAGIPILTNAIGIEGISATTQKEYVHCEDAFEYEKAIRQAYKRELDSIGSNGQRFVNEHFSLEKSKNRYFASLVTL